MPLPAVTRRRKGMTSSGPSGPPKPRRITASYGASGDGWVSSVVGAASGVMSPPSVGEQGSWGRSPEGRRARQVGLERNGVGALRSRRTASIRRAKTRPAAVQSTQSWSDPSWAATTTRTDPSIAGTAYSSRRSTSGTCPASRSRTTPPPTAVMTPTRTAAMGDTPGVVTALRLPDTAKAPRPAASSTRTKRVMRSTPGWKRKVTSPPSVAAVSRRQSLMPTGGMSPMSRSRTMPPPRAAAQASTSTPKRSKRFLTATSPPESAKTNTPTRSRASCADAKVVGMPEQTVPVRRGRFGGHPGRWHARQHGAPAGTRDRSTITAGPRRLGTGRPTHAAPQARRRPRGRIAPAAGRRRGQPLLRPARRVAPGCGTARPTAAGPAPDRDLRWAAAQGRPGDDPRRHDGGGGRRAGGLAGREGPPLRGPDPRRTRAHRRPRPSGAAPAAWRLARRGPDPRRARHRAPAHPRDRLRQGPVGLTSHRQGRLDRPAPLHRRWSRAGGRLAVRPARPHGLGRRRRGPLAQRG